MILIKKILLTNDFSKSSENVVATAIEIAKIFKSEVIPIHILPDDIVNEKVKSLLKETAMKKLEETVKKAENEGVKVGDPILDFGTPHRGIVQSSVDANVNLVLTGSGENQKGDKFLLGTTTERIIQKSDKPVFVVKEGASLHVKRILCPVDFSATSKRALRNAITMAYRFNAELIILSVCELNKTTWLSSEKDRTTENDSRCAAHASKFENFLQEFTLVDLNWVKETRKGAPAEEILKTISEKKIDLLVMGTTGRTGLSRWVIGSVTEKVIREVPCSFLTVKSEDIISLQLKTNIQTIDNHYRMATQLMKDGFFEESIDQFKLCLSINSMHVPSYYGIADVYEKLNDSKQAKIYQDMARDILKRIWNQKIEEEARMLRGH